MIKGDSTLPRWTARCLSLTVWSAIWLTLIPQGGASGAMLTHRFPFDTTAGDVIGGASGVLQGNAALINGAVVLDGTNSGFLSDADIAADYAAGPDVIGSDFLLHIFTSNTNLTLTWGASAASWVLESSPALGAGAVWTQVSETPALENGRYRVTVPMSDDARFFRLHNPG